MLPRRVLQFLIIYLSFIGALMLLKYGLGLSDYVIPALGGIADLFFSEYRQYSMATMNTMAVAVIGQVLSVCMAFVIGILGRQSTWLGSFIKVAAYNIQAYPIVALAPILFILIGDGFLTRLLIAAMICYFPVLLTILGIMSKPIDDIEHFYRATGRMRWQLEVKIRTFENLSQLTTVIAGSATLAMAGTIVGEFIAANAGIGYSIRIALYQSDLGKILIALFFIGITIAIYQALLELLGAAVKRAWTGRP
ncbi:MAG: ABC transporter permease [Deltaproteobacteria bacterium]|nr:MAG: ABC transporter permease [Desulfobacterales bacterium]PIE73765.1 MAG: ABC transporter permease [Deltaproteobacteria bacterium]